MDNEIKNLFGLRNDNKRVYFFKEGEVEKEDFEYGRIVDQILFGDRGIVDSLRNAWEIVHDPRFTKIEAAFIIPHKSRVGGDATEGVVRQLKDGTFTGGMTGIEQYTEVLEEGRLLLGALRSMAIVQAAAELFPGRTFRIDPKDIHRGIKFAAAYTPVIRFKMYEQITETTDATEDLTKLTDDELARRVLALKGPEFFVEIGVLTPEEKKRVLDHAAHDPHYHAKAFKEWTADELWGFLHYEYPNYFTRKGAPNQKARTLFNLVKLDLVGLITDYAEIANIQEVVLLEDPDTLYEPEVHGEDIYRCSAEVELLERALTYRAEIRVTAARILDNLGISSHLPELTDLERDQLLRIIYSSNWPDDKPEMVSNVLSFLGGIKASRQTVDERRAQQLKLASEAAKKHCISLATGEVLPITRHTEEVVHPEMTLEERIQQSILTNAVATDVFLRLSKLESDLDDAKAEFLKHDEKHRRQRTDLLDHCVKAAEDSTYTGTAVTNYAINEPTQSRLARIGNLVKAIALLKPLFESENFLWTDEAVADVLNEVDKLLPKEKQVVPQFEGVYEGAQFIKKENPGFDIVEVKSV